MENQGKRYNKEFKLETLRLVLEKGRSVPSVAADLGISLETLYNWDNFFE